MLDARFWMVVVFFEHQATNIEKKQATSIEQPASRNKQPASRINYNIEGSPIQPGFWRYLPKWNIRN